MKHASILIAALALPASIAFAQTPTPTTTGSSIPFIPLVGSSGNAGSSTTGGTTGTATGASAWFIDTAARLVVFCSETTTAGGTGTTAGAGAFTCTAQPVPTGPTGGATPAPAPSAGAAPTSR
ncbi:MAG TPA: hypothetical protein VJ698_12270 [Noviherbaspirillum sp.]|uniref:hypothetical protein n=1 Tax=Noviherbaspirillum sp. TaxID=1926288 RepID=UPI002B462114|nr:hypothetical protein [Noviherbaspirillum sp.]HJV86240.1 hypothetical protein [Noviherbaspirillum sp.]